MESTYDVCWNIKDLHIELCTSYLLNMLWALQNIRNKSTYQVQKSKSYRLLLDRSYKEIFWTRHNTNFFWKPLLTRIYCLFTFSHAEKQFCLWEWKIPVLCLTVLLICCILKARNCKNIHRNTYSTNRDIYCKTIKAFSECFFKQ